jgi:hypothetical protein
MGLFSIIPNVIGGVFGIATKWLEGTQKITEAKLQAKIVTIESTARIAEAKATAFINLAASEQDHSQAWERVLVEESGKSWKDEWWTLIVSAPLIMSFIPQLAQYVPIGFANLDTVPDWYLYIVFAAVSFAFARRELLPALKGLRKPK